MSKIEAQGASPNGTHGAPTSFMVPSLLQVRRFLFEQGMVIVPWACTREVLDELHSLLQTHSTDDPFWQSLHGLLQALNFDLQRLLPEQTRTNEVPSLAARETSLDEIRACVSTQTPGFADLLRRISHGCLPVLLLLAGAVAVSCGARAEDNRQPGASAAGGVTAAGGAFAAGGHPAPGSGGTLSDYEIVTQTATGGTRVVNPNGTVPCVETWDAAGPLNMSDMQSIANQCIAPSGLRDDVLACLATLNTSWEKAIESLLNCRDCEQAADTLTALLHSCSGLPAHFDRCILEPWYCTPPYMGVRLA